MRRTFWYVAVTSFEAQRSIWTFYKAGMRILDALRTATETLEEAGIDDPLADAEIIIWYAADVDRLAAFLDNPEMSPPTLAKIRRLTKRRAKGEPVQYIVGHVEFYGLKIAVGKGVLIPRPETELLVEEAAKTLKEGSRVKGHDPSLAACSLQFTPAILDLCTGSGCIALALAKAFPGTEVLGTDISQKALHFAKKNALAHNVTNIKFRKGSLFEPVKRGEKFDLVTANPPYIVRSEIPGLQKEVTDWEPHTALDGGNDGLDFYREIFDKAGQHLKPTGSLLVELGYGQANAVSGIAEQEGFNVVAVTRDLAGIKRILRATMAVRSAVATLRTGRDSRSKGPV